MESRVVLCLALVAMTTVAQDQDMAKVCRIDLVLVVDKSGSIGTDAPYGKMENWYQVRAFLENIIQRLEVGDDDTMVGLTTFNGKGHIEFALGSKSKNAMVDYVKTLKYPGGGRTNTNEGLKYAETLLMNFQARPDAKEVILLITDGKATPVLNTNLTRTVESLKARGVRIFGVGVTDQIDEPELRSIVSDPDVDYLTIDQFDQLMDSLDQVIEDVCRIVVCPGNKIYRCAFDNCTKSCDNPDPQVANPPVCGRVCRSACVCPDDKPFQFADDVCGTEASCECEGDKVFSRCVTDNCEPTCADPDPQCGTVCHAGCVCPARLPVTLPGGTCGTPDDCASGQCVIDLILAVDESGSIALDAAVNNWPIMEQFIENIVIGLQIGAPYTRVGMVMFNTDAREIFRLNTYFKKGDMIDRIRAIHCRCEEGGFTNTTGALRLTREELLHESAGDRPTVQTVILLITDGNDNRENASLMAEVNRIKGMGVRIMAVGVTDQIDKQELRSIVTNQRDYFEVDQFVELALVLDGLLQQTCSIAPSPRQCPAPQPMENAIGFSAYISVDEQTLSPLSTVVFDRVYTNVGDHYSTTTGVFTCPCKGMYLFFHEWSGVSQGLSTAIMHNNNKIVSPVAFVSVHGAMSTNTIIVCDIGEQVHVKITKMASDGMIVCNGQEQSHAGFGGTMLVPLA